VSTEHCLCQHEHARISPGPAQWATRRCDGRGISHVAARDLSRPSSAPLRLADECALHWDARRGPRFPL